MLLNFEQLQEFTKRQKPSAVIRWLNERRIAWTTDGQGRPCTTLTQIDRALAGDQAHEFDFEGGDQWEARSH